MIRLQPYFYRPLLILVALFAAQSAGGQGVIQTPEMIRVHVDHSDGGVWVEWKAVEDTTVDLYRIYKTTNGTGELIFTVPKEVLKLKVPGQNGEAIHLSYSVTAYDTLGGNESPIGANEHKAVSLEVSYEACNRENILTWTPYQGWDGMVAGYKIYGGPAGDSLQYLSTKRSTDTLYIHEDVIPGETYGYYVEAVKSDGIISHSPLVVFSSTYASAPTFLRIEQVSVVDKTMVEIKVSADMDSPVNDYRLMRQLPGADSWKEVQSLDDVLQSPFTMTDQFNTGLQYYKYMVQAMYTPENCPRSTPVAQSGEANSILLRSSQENLTAILNWNTYEGFEGGLAEYRVYRRSDAGDFQEVDILSPQNNMWQENLEQLLDGFQKGELEYRVAALSNPSEGIETAISFSNVATVNFQSQIRLPNAFTPNSNDVNSEFKPLFDFTPEKYIMVIYDRAGRKVFTSSDPSLGWKGTNERGRYVMEGVYIYHIQFTDYSGRFQTRTGNVTVFYPSL